MFARIIGFIAVWLVAGCSLPAGPAYVPRDEWKDLDLGEGIQAGAATPAKLWLHGASGKVIEIDRGSADRRIVAEHVRAILQDGARLWAAVDGDKGLIVVDLADPSTVRLELGESAYRPILFKLRGALAVRTGDAVFVRTGTGWKRSDLSPRSMPGQVSSAASVTDGVYFGINGGEWGGGLFSSRSTLRAGSLRRQMTAPLAASEGPSPPAARSPELSPTVTAPDASSLQPANGT